MGYFTQYIAKQFGNPSGLGGKLIHRIMNRQNERLYGAVLNTIQIQPNDSILEIGFGNGYLIGMLARQNPQKIYGIERSQYMVSLVRHNLENLIVNEKLELKLANISTLPFNNDSFNKICTVNTLYFWDDTAASFAEIYRTLRPKGTFINVFYTQSALNKMRHTQYFYSKYSTSRIIEMTKECGLEIKKVMEIQQDVSYCIIAEKR